MSSPALNSPALQVITIPHRPTPTVEEIDSELSGPLSIILGAPGLVAAWKGRRYEDKFTILLVLLWSDISASHAFFTTALYNKFHKSMQPSLKGRKITWQQHALIGRSALSDMAHLKSAIESPCIEFALTKVVEGEVAGYYEAFQRVVSKILDKDPGCGGWWISPILENPQDQLLLINWNSFNVSPRPFPGRVVPNVDC